MGSPVARLAELGQSPWYDNLTRPLARGGLARLVSEHGIRGVTSNPTIFEKAIAAGGDYDEQLREELARHGDVRRAYWALVERDIADAADVLRPWYEEWGHADGYVSVEVDPGLAHDPDGTVAQARDLFGRLARPNLMIKIPATAAGIPAITRAIAEGINVNVTLIFSLDRYRAVIEAYLAGLEARAARGEPLADVASVASFFVSRVDTETDRRLPEGHPLRGRAAVANAKLAYQVFLGAFAGPRWEALAAAGARLQRPLWASTSTKNPAYPPTLYVDELIGPNTVNTLADASLDALVAGHGTLRPGTVTEDVEGARAVVAGLAAAGVDLDDVTATLEREGVAAFSASYRAALATLEERGRAVTGAGRARPAGG
ncbi:MAG: transaldolase 1 [Acidimicrobiia bacterium]|nr:MAG: transaldolase 1 [Acidimicrobiia bacterium]